MVMPELDDRMAGIANCSSITQIEFVSATMQPNRSGGLLLVQIV